MPGSSCGHTPAEPISCGPIAPSSAAPVIGDPVYGRGGGGEPLMLYARSISSPLYPAPPPLEIIDFLK